MKSNALINTSIVIAGIGIIVVIPGLFSRPLFNTSPDSPIYLGLVMLLAITSIIFAVIQIWPELRRFAQQKLHTLDKKQIHPSSADSRTGKEWWDGENDYLNREEDDAFLEALMRVIAELPPHQRDVLFRRLDSEIGWKNVDVSSGRGNPVKVTTEVKGTPITIELPDVMKVGDVVKVLMRDFQAPIHTSAETKIQPGIIREDKETYQIEDTAE